jgi:hypothetical protein
MGEEYKYYFPYVQCPKCRVFNQAAIEMGYGSGICEECMDKYFVLVDLPYDPYRKDLLKEEEGEK